MAAGGVTPPEEGVGGGGGDSSGDGGAGHGSGSPAPETPPAPPTPTDPDEPAPQLAAGTAAQQQLVRRRRQQLQRRWRQLVRGVAAGWVASMTAACHVLGEHPPGIADLAEAIHWWVAPPCNRIPRTDLHPAHVTRPPNNPG